MTYECKALVFGLENNVMGAQGQQYPTAPDNGQGLSGYRPALEGDRDRTRSVGR